MATRVLLVDDHELLLEGLSTLLEKEAGIEVAGRAKDGVEAVQLTLELKPDLVVMDLSLPRMSGVEATRQIKTRLPDTRVLCLSMHTEKQFVLAAFEAGVSGYVLKDQPLNVVIEGLHAVMAGRTFLCEQITQTVVGEFLSTNGRRTSSRVELLTTRELEILKLIVDGHSTKGIGEYLHLSPKTVSSHRENIKDKLGIDNVAGLTKFAIRHGLTTVESDSANTESGEA